MQTVDQEGQALAWTAVNRTDVACLEARGTRMQRTSGVSVTSPAKVCLTTRYGCLHIHSTKNTIDAICDKKKLLTQTNWDTYLYTACKKHSL